MGRRPGAGGGGEWLATAGTFGPARVSLALVVLVLEFVSDAEPDLALVAALDAFDQVEAGLLSHPEFTGTFASFA